MRSRGRAGSLLQVGVLVLVGCADGPARRANGCDVDCPENTRRVEGRATETVVEGSFHYSTDASCEVLCEPTQPCLSPNLPSVTRTDGGSSYVCRPVEGFADIPTPQEVDLSFGAAWHEVADPVVSTLDAEVTALFGFDGDGDGLDDLYGLSPPDALFAASRGDGTFGPVTRTPAPDLTGTLALGDVNGDGFADWITVVTLDWSTSLVSLRWLRGTAVNAWDPPQELAQYNSTTWGTTLWIVDLDGDGIDDVLVDNFRSDANVGVAFGAPGGPGAPVGVPVAPASSGSLQAAWGDVNGDGLLDLVTLADRGSVFTQDAPGTFRSMATNLWDQDWVVAGLGLADLDGDGLDDVWAALPDGASTWRSTGSAFEAGETAPLEATLGARVGSGDFDGDGSIDVLGYAWDFASGFNAAVTVHAIGNGVPSFVTRGMPFGGVVGTAGDFDGDGRSESVWLAPDTTVDGSATIAWVTL